MKQKYKGTMFYVYLDPEKVWEYIETNKSIDDLYPEHFNKDKTNEINLKKISKHLLDGEECVFICNDDYILTSYARVYNCKHDRFGTVAFLLNKELKISIRGTRHILNNIFKQQNWKLNYDEILKRYIKNKWPMKVLYNKPINNS
jgi:hypothetical protein